MGFLSGIDWYAVALGQLSFATPKKVLLRDIRLGILLRAIQIAIIGYTLYDVLTKGSYLVIETPRGIVTPRGDDSIAFKTLSADVALNMKYCKNGRDYWLVHENESATFIRCMYQRGGMWKRQADSISFTTYMMEDKLWYVKTPSTEVCEKDGTRWLKDANYNTPRYAAGACIYRRTRNWFPVGVEYLQMGFWHSFTTSQVNEYGSLPRTVIRRVGSKKNLFEFQKGQQPFLPVYKWLRYAGIDLDRRLDDQPFFKVKEEDTTRAPLPDTLRGNLTDNNGTATNQTDYPYARLSGVQLVMNIQYYNYHMWPGTPPSQPKTQRGEVLCVVEIAPVMTYAGASSSIQYLMNSLDQPNFLTLDAPARNSSKDTTDVDFSSTELLSNGIVFQFVSGGALGKFSLSNLITIITRAAVLLGVADTVVLMVAKFALGTVSSLYSEFTMETCDFRREYARFAAQAIVAGFMFLSMDKDGTGCLDKSEMAQALKKVLGNTLDEQETGRLTDFLLRHGDEDQNTFKRKLDKNTGLLDENTKISLTEWIDIFTEDKANVQALKRILKAEYKELESHMSDNCMNLMTTKEAPGVDQDLHVKDVENNQQVVNAQYAAEQMASQLTDYRHGLLPPGDAGTGVHPPKDNRPHL